MRRKAVICLSLLLVHSSCGHRKDPHRPIADTRDGIRIGWIRPGSADSLLADTIRIELSVAGDDVGPIVVTADDSVIAVVGWPPWRVAWLPPGDPRMIRLGAAAGGAKAPDRAIRWTTNDPPCVQIIGIPGAGGITRAPTDSLHAIASDPEDGDLDGRAIVWTSDLQGLLGFGRRIPTESLIRGRHLVRARAIDRWGRAATAERSIEAFDPPDPTTPAGAIEALRHAMIAADSALYLSVIDPAYRFLLCPAERRDDPSLPAGWELAGEQTFARRLESLRRAEWLLVSLERIEIEGEDWAKGELSGLSIEYEKPPGAALRVIEGSGRIFLRLRPGSESWKVAQWNDLGAAGLSYGRLRLIVSGSLVHENLVITRIRSTGCPHSVDNSER